MHRFTTPMLILLYLWLYMFVKAVAGKSFTSFIFKIYHSSGTEFSDLDYEYPPCQEVITEVWYPDDSQDLL